MTVSPSLDGTAVTGTFSTVTSKALTISTAVANDLIVMCVAVEKGTTAIQTVASCTSTHLTFAKVGSIAVANDRNMEVWTARATGTLTSEVVTCTLSAQTDDGCMALFAVQDCTGLDPNGSLPATNTGVGATGSVTGISTTNPADLLTSFYMNSNGSPPGAGTGYTNIASMTNGGGVGICAAQIDTQSVSVTQSSVTASTATFSTRNWSMMVLAFTNSGVVEVDIPTTTHGLGVSMTASIGLTLPALNVGLGITFAAGQPQNFPVVKVIPAPFLLGVSEAWNIAANLSLPSVKFSLGLTLARWEVTQVVPIAASMALGVGEVIARFGTTLPLPTVMMGLGINSNLPLITGGSTRQIHTVIDVAT